DAQALIIHPAELPCLLDHLAEAKVPGVRCRRATQALDRGDRNPGVLVRRDFNVAGRLPGRRPGADAEQAEPAEIIAVAKRERFLLEYHDHLCLRFTKRSLMRAGKGAI